MKELLLKKHRFVFTGEDEASFEHVYSVFHQFGPELNYNSGTGSGRVGRAGGMPNYADLMTASDRQGEKRSYLASEANYRVIRDLERRNLIVPLTGFAIISYVLWNMDVNARMLGVLWLAAGIAIVMLLKLLGQKSALPLE